MGTALWTNSSSVNHASYHYKSLKVQMHPGAHAPKNDALARHFQKLAVISSRRFRSQPPQTYTIETLFSAEERFSCCEHVRYEWQIGIRSRKGRHHLTIIWFDLACEGRDGTRNTCLGNKGHQAEHRKAAVVDLNVQLVSLL